MSESLETHIIEILTKPLKEMGYDLYEVTFAPGKEASLNITVDRVEPISLEDIVEVSNAVSALLDEDDPIEGAYNLDVSSLGAEKPLAKENLPLYTGRYVNLKLSKAYKGLNEIEGTLLSVEGEILTLSYRDKTRTLQAEIPLSDISKARLAIKF